MRISLVQYYLGSIFLLVSVSCSGDGNREKDVECNKEYTAINAKLSSDTAKSLDYSDYKNIDDRLSSVISSCPDHARLKVIKAQVQVSLGKNKDALKYIDEALSIDPAYAKGIHLKGMILSLLGKKEQSLYLMRKSLSIDPDNIDFLVNYCSTLEMYSMYEEAIEACNKAVRHKQAPSAAYYIRGRVHESLGEDKKAKADYDKARELGFTMWPDK